MICDLFFAGKLKEIEDVLIYEEDFVLFYLKMQLIGKCEFNKEMVENFLEQLYGKENIKNNGVLKFCERHFISNGKNFELNVIEEEIDLYNRTKKFQQEIIDYSNIDKKELYNLLEKEVMDKTIPFYYKLEKFIIFNCYKNNLNLSNEYVLLYKCFYILRDYYKMYRTIDYKLEKIPDFFNIIEISELNLKEEQMSFLIFNNVFTIKNLKRVPIEDLICIFCNNVDDFIQTLNKYAITKREIIADLEEKFNKIIKDDWNRVLEKRFELTDKKSTLAEIGREFNLTRERVRQIEKKATQKILDIMIEEQKVINCFYKDINRDHSSFITSEDFIKYIDNDIVSRNLIIAFNSDNSRIKYNEQYGIIYDSKEMDLDDIIKEANDGLKDIISINEINEYNKVQNYIIKNDYRIYQDRVLVRKSVNISAIYTNEIEENFVEGYNIGSEDDYNRLLQIIKNKYGEIEVPSMHSIQAMIDRNDFIQIDRGTYKAKKYCVTLPEKLLNEILDFIIKNSPVIAYSLIFEKFKLKLQKINVYNRFYLKGILDEKLPREFNTGRDFINTNSTENISTYDIMKKIFKSFDGEFTIEDIREKMPGLKAYNYENYAKAEENNGLIRVEAKTYIYIDKLGITEGTKNELKQFIDNLFKKMDSTILTAKKIYANLNILNKELFNKLHITAKFGDFELFSIVQYLFKDDYFYSRPIISLQEDFTTSSYLLIKEYVSRFEKFNYTDIKKYIYKMNIGGLYSYMSFMEDLSDEYVQISKDGMIKKDKFYISEENLLKIKELVDLILKNNNLKTEEFNGYFMLPKLDRPWNKYMLVGIIRSYFREEYEIENTTRFYDTTDFIIRRIN